ncbi:hypothetical protein [Paenibacillus radicis (ex Xue et al. 2023)]|uniref:DUF3862 domain-containing protein n=1 Tax=Paenibacillus radicis (ex Xue et al. 2023) TaxID=2972489 RepID=A0ABT1YJL7_9BACL|nr:hypothetical protein [Paenibacillus radicis (ex Xue et al. 2023)]MCR8633392.1 hypothetical protein [Paenibacillus radicis (ex Xue et al. 2023)]
MKMNKLYIGLLALLLVGTACTKQENKPAQNTEPPVSSPSGIQPPATAPSGNNTPVTPPANNADASKPDSGKTDPAPVEAPKGAKEQPIATKEQLDSVDFGMTYDEVSKKMGQIGKLTSESKDDSGMNVFQTYQYKTKDGQNMNVTFRNGKVLNKSG